MSSRKQQAEDVRDEVADAVRGKLPLKSKCANMTLLIVNAVFFIVGVAFALGSASLLSVSEQFYGNGTFKTQLIIGLRLSLATGIFLVALSLLGCLATCRVSAFGFACYTCLLATVVILQLTAAVLIFVFGASVASMQVGGPSFRWQNGTIKKEWHTRPAYVIEHEAIRSFLNDTYTECCIHQHWTPDTGTSDTDRPNENSPQWRHCALAERLAGKCDGKTSHEFRRALKHGIASYAYPTAAAMLAFVVIELMVLIVASCVMWRICATPRTQYKVEKGFSKIEMK